ncbi:MAG: tetratricopeptide repeat protein, partial [Chloroflexi bacterium]|nr:tetratricopeptide repeat protein [Chloroflexota bacterium]
PDGKGAVLITSRRHDLAVTDSAYRLYLAPFDQYKDESISLFGRILGEKRVQAEAQLYQQIANLSGHLPLAVNIIAQRLQHEPGWTATQLLTRLQHKQERLNLLTRGDQQVRLSFALSYDALNQADQVLFAMLNIFPGTFSAASAAELAQRPLWDVEDSLRRLYSLSLLQTAPDGRYQLHPLLRDFSREQAQDDELPSRFVQIFTTLAQKETALEVECHNIVAAIKLAWQLQLPEYVITAVMALYPYLQRKGQLEQAADLLNLAQLSARSSQNMTALTHILHNSGYVAMKQGQPDQAETYYQEALTLAQQTKDRNQTADILLKLGALAYRRGRLEEAQQFYDEALPLARQQQNSALVASLLTNLGLVQAAVGGLTAAIAHYQEALPLAREVENPALASNILQNLGNMQEERGDYAQAKLCYEEGLALAETLNDPELRSRMLGNLGAVAAHLGNYAEAVAHFRAGLALAEANGLSIQIYRQQANLGFAATLRGQFRQANIHYQEALALVRSLAFPEDLGMILNQAGDCYLAQDVYQDAAVCFTEALQIAEAGNLLRIRPFSLFGLAKVTAARGNVAEARRLGQQSREQLLAIGHQKANEVWWWLQELPGEAAVT